MAMMGTIDESGASSGTGELAAPVNGGGDRGERTALSRSQRVWPILGACLALCLVVAVPQTNHAETAPSSKGSAPGDGLVLVPAGCFNQGTQDNYSDERPRHRVCLGAFQIQELEVSVAAYGRCVAAGRCTEPVGHLGSHPTRRLCTDRAPGREAHPVNCVTWEQARVYCAFVGLRLPTEAEWERAALGPGRGPHPWGAARADCTRAVVAEVKDGRLVPGCGTGGALARGARAADRSAAGVRDLAGSVSEWTQDWFGLRAYKTAQTEQPRGALSGRARVVRGGSFRTPPGSRLLRTTARQFSATWDPTIGFRCARDARAGAPATPE